MRSWILTLALLGGLTFFGPLSQAQRPGEGRILTVSPPNDPPTAGVESNPVWLSAYGGWISTGPYLPAHRDHAWHHEIGGVLELVRGEAWSLLALAQTTLVADPNNSIRFNPRANFWEEGLLFVRRYEGFSLQLGYVHRCKHDIDNLDRGEQRAMISGSVLGRAFVPLSPGPNGSYVAVQTDLYTTLQDARTPSALEEVDPNWEQLLGGIGLDVHLRRSLPWQGVDAYLAPSGGVLIFGRNDAFIGRFGTLEQIRGNGGASAGLSVRGRAELRMEMAYTYLSDTAIPARPQDAHLFRLAVQILSSPMVR